MEHQEPSRHALVAILHSMPYEAFSWVVVALMQDRHIFPDGLGGFREESRESILALYHEVDRYLGQ